MADIPLPESEQIDAGAKAPDLGDVHETAMARFDSVAMPQIDIRAQMLADRRCISVAGGWWEDSAYSAQFENMPRPELDKVAPIAKRIQTDYRENRLIADFIPASDSADEDTAETLDGMYRADNHDFYAQEARDNAFVDALHGGFGAYRLTTEIADEYDPDNDSQRVNPGVLIVDADQSVYFDPADKSYGKRKAKWAFIVSAFPRLTAEADWGADNLVDFDTWQTSRWAWRDWYRPDTVQIAEYYVVEMVSDKLIVLTNELTGAEQRYFDSEIESSQLRDLVAQGWKKRSKDAKRRRVHKYILNGSQVLKDCGHIAGTRIPIVPVYGEREFTDGLERPRGIVRKLVDAQRAFHAALAKVIETQSISAQDMPLIAPEQVPGQLGDIWSRRHIDRPAYLPLVPIRGEDGSVVQAGLSGTLPSPQVQPATVQLLGMLSQTFAAENENADEVKANVSADAMDIAAARVDADSAAYLDNMRQSIAIEGEIYLDMAREVYYEPGRKVATMSADDQDGTATLAEPVIGDNGVFRIRNDLQAGRYKVIADVQESTATKRQKTVRTMTNLAQVAGSLGNQQLGNAALITAVMNEDGEGMEDIRSYVRNLGISMGVVKPTPEEQQQLAQAQQAEQQGKQPDPASAALLAQADSFTAKASADRAKATETLAKAHLETVQAETLSKVPKVPSGLEAAPTNPAIQAANDQADVIAKHASARLDDAKAAHLEHDIHDRRLRTGAEISDMEHGQRMAERQASDAA